MVNAENIIYLTWTFFFNKLYQTSV